jgi:hypothetical protein
VCSSDLIEIVAGWRESGKALTKEQEIFAEGVADRMLTAKVKGKAGVQLISKSHLEFIKGMQPVQDSDRVGACNQDAVANGPADKDGKFKRKTAEQDTTTGAKVVKASIPKADSISEPGDKQPNVVSQSASESSVTTRNTPDLPKIPLEIPENQKEGEVTAVADEKTDPKEMTTDSDEEIAIEEIGHNPDLPMPKKMAEELIGNAKWGVEIGVYTNLKEGISRQLGNKAYEEFIDTEDKLKEVADYLMGLANIEPEPVA